MNATKWQHNRFYCSDDDNNDNDGDAAPKSTHTHTHTFSHILHNHISGRGGTYVEKVILMSFLKNMSFSLSEEKKNFFYII